MDKDAKKAWAENLSASKDKKPGSTYRGKTHPYFAENNLCVDIPIFKIYKENIGASKLYPYNKTEGTIEIERDNRNQSEIIETIPDTSTNSLEIPETITGVRKSEIIETIVDTNSDPLGIPETITGARKSEIIETIVDTNTNSSEIPETIITGVRKSEIIETIVDTSTSSSEIPETIAGVRKSEIIETIVDTNSDPLGIPETTASSDYLDIFQIVDDTSSAPHAFQTQKPQSEIFETITDTSNTLGGSTPRSQIPETIMQEEATPSSHQQKLKKSTELDTMDMDDIFDKNEDILPESDYDENLDSALSSYRIDGEIARGGMGVVYQAWQNSLKRKVAIKQILPHSWKPSVQEKFIAEATVTAYLNHPNIPAVYDLGQSQEGEIIMTMQLVHGVSWVSLLYPENISEIEQAQKYTEEDHINILLNICDAIAFAHSKGVAHNDLKPENIMIGEFREVYIMDWGIAVDFWDYREDALPIVKKNMVKKPMGTPSYMPIELATGKGAQIGPWTDVYLVGGLLYEIIERTPPRTGDTALDVLDDAIEGKTPNFTNNIPYELRQICLKALAKYPQNRYQNITELQNDIRGYLRHKQSLLISHTSQETLKKTLLIANINKQEYIKSYDNFAKVVAGFEQALLLWSNNKNAVEGKKRARIEYAKLAIKKGDILLAEAQLSEINQSNQNVQNLNQEIQQAKQKRRRTQRMMRKLRSTLVVAIVVIICGLLTVLLSIQEKQKKMALQYASLYTEALTEFRSAYSSKIVNKVKKHGIKVTHDYNKDNQIPFPATFSIELAEQISKKKNGIQARLYSNEPFPWRKDGGVRDEFEEIALDAVHKNPEEPFFRIEKRNKVPSLRYAKAVVLKASCVECHNSHPQSPRTNWKVGDVRGIQEVTIPLGSTFNEVKKLTFRIFLPIAILMLLIIFVIATMVSRKLKIRL